MIPCSRALRVLPETVTSAHMWLDQTVVHREETSVHMWLDLTVVHMEDSDPRSHPKALHPRGALCAFRPEATTSVTSGSTKQSSTLRLAT